MGLARKSLKNDEDVNERDIVYIRKLILLFNITQYVLMSVMNFRDGE